MDVHVRGGTQLYNFPTHLKHMMTKTTVSKGLSRKLELTHADWPDQGRQRATPFLAHAERRNDDAP